MLTPNQKSSLVSELESKKLSHTPSSFCCEKSPRVARHQIKNAVSFESLAALAGKSLITNVPVKVGRGRVKRNIKLSSAVIVVARISTHHGRIYGEADGASTLPPLPPEMLGHYFYAS